MKKELSTKETPFEYQNLQLVYAGKGYFRFRESPYGSWEERGTLDLQLLILWDLGPKQDRNKNRGVVQ